MKIINSIIGILLGSFSYFIVKKLFLSIVVELFDLFPELHNCQGTLAIVLVVFLELSLTCLIILIIRYSILNKIKVTYLLIAISGLCLTISLGHIFSYCNSIWDRMVYSEIVLAHICVFVFSFKCLYKYILHCTNDKMS